MPCPKQAALWVLILAATICGCGSPAATKFYVLDVPATPNNASAPQFPISLLVSRPVTSHLYRDDRIVFGSGPVQLGTYEYHRWAESPADMVQDLLVGYLRSSGQYRSVLRPGSSARGDYIVRSYLKALYEVDEPNFVARFDMHIEIYDPKSGVNLRGFSYSHDEPVANKTVAAVVEALDKNVREGMTQLTADMGKYFADHPPKAEGAQ